MSRLNKGLERNEMNGRVSPFQLSPPADFFELYECIDGTHVSEGDMLDDIHFFPGFYFLSLTDVLSIYNAVHRDSRWESSWLPVFANGGGDFFCVECDMQAEKYGNIIGFLLGEPEQFVHYVSLSSMMSTIKECFEKAAYFVATEGYLEIDMEEEQKIARRHNPGLPRWGS